MGKLKREHVKRAKLAYEDVTIPEWPDDNGEPGDAKIVQLPAGELIEFLNLTDDPTQKRFGMFHIVQKCLRDRETDETILDPEDLEHFKEAGNYAVYSRLQKVALRLNALTAGVSEEIKKILREAAIAVSPIVLPDKSERSTSIEKSST